jgi:hypothetical protein
MIDCSDDENTAALQTIWGRPKQVNKVKQELGLRCVTTIAANGASPFFPC